MKQSLTYSQLASSVIEVMAKASDAILQIYRTADGELKGAQPMNVQYKDDASPVTEADIAAHHILTKGLSLLLSDTPILSEEGVVAEISERKKWRRYWLIDPLDGTKEFIRRNGEFTVNVALIEDGCPVLGVITVPVTGVSYWGAKGCGAYKVFCEQERVLTKAIHSLALHSCASSARPLSVVSSRHYGCATMQSVEHVLKQHFTAIDYQGVGSSLKFCLVAEGKADFYPRLAPTSEWDTAAAQAIVEAAGGAVLGLDFEPLRYNTKNSLLNPYFYVVGDNQYDWKGILSQISAE